MRFKDKVELVVGGACGMGAATVTQLVREGAHVVVLDLNEDAYGELVEDESLAEGPGTVELVSGDVNDKAVRDAAITLVREKFGALDGLLYVAGVLDLMSPAEQTDDELWDYVMNVNVNSTFRMCRDCLPLLKDHDGPSANIIIVGSVGGIYGSTAGAAYVTSKHAVLGLARNLAWSYHYNNIRVNVVNPGSVMTDILANAMDRWPDRDILNTEGDLLYNKRGSVSLSVDADGGYVMGQPEDIARTILFLLDDDSSFINGAQVTVDGGWTSF